MTPLRSAFATISLRDAPYWGSSRKRRFARLLTFALYLYVFHVLVLLSLERRLAFAGWTFDWGWDAPPAGVRVEELDIATADGNTVRAWWMAPDGWTPAKGAVLFAHGSGRNISHAGGNLRRWRDNLDTAVLGYDYPGYGRSTGKPNEESCYASAEAALGWLLEAKHIMAKDVVLVGESMGGAMAVDLASRHDCRMVILMGAYTSFPDIAQRQWFWIPCRQMVSMRFDNLGKIATLRTPVFVAHGTVDGVVPFAQGERLYDAAPEPKRFYAMADHPHMHPRRPDFYAAVRTFMAETRRD